MRALSTAELFAAWEQGLDQNMIIRNLLILVKACESTSLNDLAQISIGERDARLLAVRQTAFGSKMQQTANCPACNEKTEWETPTSQLCVQQFDHSLSYKAFTKKIDAFEIEYRLVNSMDVLSIIQSSMSTEEARSKLLSNCLLETKRSGITVSSNQVPVSILNTIEAEMSLQDPQADIRFDLTCPACNHHWQAGFDILSFFLV